MRRSAPSPPTPVVDRRPEPRGVPCQGVANSIPCRPGRGPAGWAQRSAHKPGTVTPDPSSSSLERS